MTTSPESRNRRSLLVTAHRNAQAQFRLWQNQVVVQTYGQRTAQESHVARQLGLCDLSTLDRVGYKGADTVGWLERQGRQVPAKPNQALFSESDGLVARLSAEEHVFLGSPFSGRPAYATFETPPNADQRVYKLPRQDSHAWLYLSGEHAAEMMSYVCAIDLSGQAFAPLDVAQTSVAKLNAIVIRHDIGTTPGFHLLCDQPSVAYWWEALLDAAQPFDGAAIGMDALLALGVSAALEPL